MASSQPSPLPLQDKVAIVTGSSRGIGAAIAIELAALGASVIVNYASPGSAADAEAVADSIQAAGGRCVVVRANLGELEAIDVLVSAALAHFGGLNILVNCAAVCFDGHLDDITLEHFDQYTNVNLRGPLFLCKAASQHMKAGDRIINISSVAARVAYPGQLIYACYKAAIEAMTRNLALDLKEKGITVNAVNPGPTETRMFRTAVPEHIQEVILDTAPMARPVDIANVVGFLATDKARWINGSVTNANCGMVPV